MVIARMQAAKAVTFSLATVLVCLASDTPLYEARPVFLHAPGEVAEARDLAFTSRYLRINEYLFHGKEPRPSIAARHDNKEALSFAV